MNDDAFHPYSASDSEINIDSFDSPGAYRATIIVCFVETNPFGRLNSSIRLYLRSDFRDNVEAHRDEQNKSLDRLLPVDAHAHD